MALKKKDSQKLIIMLARGEKPPYVTNIIAMVVIIAPSRNRAPVKDRTPPTIINFFSSIDFDTLFPMSFFNIVYLLVRSL